MKPILAKSALLLQLAIALCSAQQTAEAQPPAVYGQLPLTFEDNRGQTGTQASFIARGRGYTAVLTPQGMVLSLHSSEAFANDADLAATRSAPRLTSSLLLKLKLVGASTNPSFIGEDPQPGRVNYFIGNNKSHWRTNVPTYARVRYEDVYPGIDLVYYGNHRQLEYDFVISPGADPNAIQFEIEGAQGIRLDTGGNLVLDTGADPIQFQCPTVYQETNGSRVQVEGGYVLTSSTHVSFHVGGFDPGRPIVIDPALVYSTYLGGSGSSQATGIAVDSGGNVYVSGYTNSTDFPLTGFGSPVSGADHVFVAKFDPTGSTLLYSDYLGGNGPDYGYALALDSSNEVYITGSTQSSDFPVVNAYQPTYPGSLNAFVSRISSDGSSLLYSTYLGGSGSDMPTSIAIDGMGEIVVAGSTSSTNFPVMNAYQATASPNLAGLYGIYGFLTKFTADGSSLMYSTYLAGNSNVPNSCGGSPCWSQPYNTIQSMTIDGSGNAYVGGTTNTYNFPATAGAYQTTDTTQLDQEVGFVAKLNGSGSLLYSTYLYESSGYTSISGIAVDAAGSPYVTGSAASNGLFPITSTTICDPAIYTSACGYVFVTKFNPDASSLVYSTFLGPNNSGSQSSIALDMNNDAYVLATTSSSTFGEVNGIEAYAGEDDILLAEIDPVAGSELWATYIGGSLDDRAAAMALDSTGNVYITAVTNSTDFPATEGAFQLQPAYKPALLTQAAYHPLEQPVPQVTTDGSTYAVVLKINTSSAPSVSLNPYSLQYPSQQVGSTSQSQQVLLRNMGSGALSLSIASSGDFAETDNCGANVPGAGSCLLSVTFSPTTLGTLSGSIIVSDNAAGSPHTVALSGTGLGSMATLTPSSLTFPSTAVGGSSTTQTLTLTNSGNVNLSFGNIQVSGDFGQSNNCPAFLAAGNMCTFTLTFAPTAPGIQNGVLTVTDNVSSGPQVVKLTGTGSDFSLTSSPGSATIKPGLTASYKLTATPMGGASSNVIKLSCTGAPTNSTCSVSPSSIASDGSASATLKLSTTEESAGVSAFLWPNHPRFAICVQLSGFWVFGMLVMESKPWRKKGRSVILAASVVSAVLFMSSCAGGTGFVPTGRVSSTPPGTYTITVTGRSGTLQHSVAVTLVVE